MNKFVPKINLTNCSNLFSLFIFFSIFVSAKNSLASGFAVYAQGAKEIGMLGAVNAHTEGPASNYYNPALITQITGTQVEAGTTFIFPNKKFTSTQTGVTAKAKKQVFFPSTLFATHEFNDTLTAGLGVFFPFGLGSDWGTDWEGRYVATNAELFTINVNPNIAFKVTEDFTLAGGIDLVYGDAVLENNINLAGLLALAGFPDGAQKFRGDGSGVGYNLGVFHRLNEVWSWGVSYRSKIDLDFEGDVTFSLPTGTPPIFNNTDGNVEINLPQQFFFGVACQATNKLLIEIGGRWEGWSSYEELRFNFVREPVTGLGTTTVEAKNWKDTWNAMIGIKYTFDPSLSVSTGYLYEGNPVPDATFEPQVSAADKSLYGLGIYKNIGAFTSSLSYAYEKYDERSKNNLVGAASGYPANGRYEQDSHIFSIALTWTPTLD